VASKPDSQEVCFLPGADHTAFVAERSPSLARTGEVVDPDGRVLAEHGGSFRFTIGQRKGTGVSLGERAYVVDVDHSANRVVVGPGELLSRRSLDADRVSWVAGEPPADGPFEAEAQIRYRGGPVPAVIEAEDDRLRIEFRRPVRAVAPGQSVVVYRGDELLGGARILRAHR
jgi:tRNA-specific 2-thiouridylase